LLIYPSQRRTTCGDLKLEKSDTSLGDLPEIEATEKRHHAEGTSVNSWKEFFTLSHWISESSQPPTLLECVGTALGFSGAALLVLKSTEEIPAEVEVPISLEGDFAAFLGALMFVLLLDAGRTLRQWMPLFIYTFPVTLTASISLGAASLIMEDTRFLGLGGNSWFGWAGGGPPLWYSLGGAAVAGMMGHLLCYLALLHIIPLVVSIMCLFEPLFGSVIGWLVGVQGVPGIWTLVAGSMLMLGAILVTFGDRSFTVNWSTLCSR
jgi:drug/metabolite transporter (DMT)-like permease